jgi:RND family efflux transporter MFP subunit
MSDETTLEPAPEHRRRRGWRWLLAAAAVLVVGAAFALGLWPRLRRRDSVRRDTAEMTRPTVSVVQPQRTAATTTIVLPGNVQAYLDSPIFSRISGYLDRWLVDIGARVKKDQLLAVISVPEVEQQLKQARGQLATAEANLQLSQSTATRFNTLGGSRAVSQQEVDNAVGALRANKATVEANQATVRQLEQSLDYALIRAPFDGIISVRNVDVGDLINAGSSTVPRTELFHIVQATKLRVYVSVPEGYAQATKPGLTAEVSFITMPGHTFKGTLVRTAKAIDPTTRVLNAELQVDNSTGALFAGAFAQVRISVPVGETWRLPVETLVFQKEGLQVATVVDGKVVMKNVTPSRDHGEWIEIAAGLNGDELVIDNPSDSIANGQEVAIARPAPATQAGPATRP